MKKMIISAVMSLMLSANAFALPISRIDPGDGLYLDNIFANSLVQVIRVDDRNNWVKIRHGNGYTEWVRPSRLLTREESAAHEVVETAIWIAVFACAMDPTLCEN